jgi:hypothetical protein
VISVITINPLPAPIVGDSLVCSGKYDTLSDAGGGTWSTADQSVAFIDTFTGILRGNALGATPIIYTLPTGCKTSKLITVDACHVAVEQIPAGKEIMVSPNPGKGDFFISGSLTSAADVDVCITVTNMLGQIVYKNKAIAHGGDISEHIQLPGNSVSGMYILSLQSEVENRTFRIVVEQ